MRRIDFFQLSRQLQERFIASAAGAAVPPPLLKSPPRLPFPVIWASAGLASITVLVVTLRYGFGDVQSRFALAPAYMLAGYGLVLWLVLLTGVGAVSVALRWRALPYRPGTYLFPIGVVDARSSQLDVYSVDELERTSVLKQPLRVQLAFKDGRTFELPIPEQRAQAVLDTLAGVQARLFDRERPLESRERALIDPLVDPGIPTPLLPDRPLVKRLPIWARSLSVLSLLPALALAWPVHTARNALSERAMVQAARAQDTPAAYTAYLEAGGSDPEVSSVLLPRAELRAAVRTESVEPIELVLARHGNSSVRQEIESALRAALLAELERTKRRGSVTALRELERRRKHRGLIQGELARAVHELYGSSVRRFRAEVAPAKADLWVSFVEQLVGYSEQHGPRVDVRFIRHRRTSLATLEERVTQSPYFGGDHFRPAQYFDAAHAAPREARLAAALIAAWQEPFPADVLRFELAPALDAKDTSWPAVEVPTLFVRHSTLFGGTYTSTAPDGIYVGVGVVFDVSFRMPRDGTSAGYTFSAWRPPDMGLVREQKLGPAELYERLATSAFEECATRYLSSVFKEP